MTKIISLNSFVLFVGIAAIAFVTGFMIGASNTPVGSIVIPSIFGLILTTVGFLQNPALSEIEKATLEEIRKESRLKNVLNDFNDTISKKASHIGIVLIIFSIFYLSGIVVGAQARIRNWMIPQKPISIKELPWKNSQIKPSSIPVALDWVLLQERLLALGYNYSQIQEIYQFKAGINDDEQIHKTILELYGLKELKVEQETEYLIHR